VLERYWDGRDCAILYSESVFLGRGAGCWVLAGTGVLAGARWSWRVTKYIRERKAGAGSWRVVLACWEVAWEERQALIDSGRTPAIRFKCLDHVYQA
jgi:hypothetical protein